MKRQKETAMRFASIALMLCLVLFSFPACGVRYRTVSRYAMGARFDLSLPAGEDEDVYTAILTDAEGLLSPAYATSLVSCLNAGKAVSLENLPDIAALFRLGEELREKTGGAFSLFAGEETALWHFDEAAVLPDADALSQAVADTCHAGLQLSEDGWLLTAGKADLGAAGKGLAVARLAAVLTEKGKSGLISAGSTTAAVGTKNGRPWRIGVRDPFSEEGALLGVLSLTDTALSTSGSYEKCFTLDGVLYHHILDARTGMPVDSGLVSVTVIVKDATLADMLSTAAFLMGAEAGMALCRAYGAEALFVTQEGELILSEGCKQLFTSRT